MSTLSPSPDAATDILVDPEVQKAPPPREWLVFMVNDDYTPMEFVVEILQDVFSMPLMKAREVMLQIHYHGRGLCGSYSREIAMQRVSQVRARAEGEGHPLLCLAEPDTKA